MGKATLISPALGMSPLVQWDIPDVISRFEQVTDCDGAPTEALVLGAATKEIVNVKYKGKRCTMLVDENGHGKQLEYNPVATNIYYTNSRGEPNKGQSPDNTYVQWHGRLMPINHDPYSDHVIVGFAILIEDARFD